MGQEGLVRIGRMFERVTDWHTRRSQFEIYSEEFSIFI